MRWYVEIEYRGRPMFSVCRIAGFTEWTTDIVHAWSVSPSHGGIDVARRVASYTAGARVVSHYELVDRGILPD